MLRLEPLFSLEKDVFPKISREHLLVPARKTADKSGAAQTYLNFLGAAVTILGKYNSDTVVLCYTGYHDETRSTFFATFDVPQSSLKVIFRQRAAQMVGCTLNLQGTLLGFTYRSAKPSVGSAEMYESCVAEAHELGICYRMTAEQASAPTPESQWLHFLPLRGNGSHLLIYVYNQSADLFNIYTQRKSTTAHSISAHPHFRNKLADRLCWFQWDESRSMIYILNIKRKIDDENHQLYVLRCIEFPDRRPSVAFKATLQMDLTMVGCRAKDNIQIVRFGHISENAYVLCQQHAQPKGNVIRVSVWVFHHDFIFDIDIPINYPGSLQSSNLHNSLQPQPELTQDYISKIKVFFDSLGDLLVIYVPGIYLQFIDCAVDHDPTVNLVLTESLFNSSLPEADPLAPPIVENFEMKSDARFGKRFSLLDRNRGLLFEYKMNQNTIVTAVPTASPMMLKQLLALALLHVQDDDTSESIILNLLRKNPSHLSSDLMKYFLIGVPYREYRKKPENVHKKVATLLPMIPPAHGASSQIVRPKKSTSSKSHNTPNGTSSLSQSSSGSSQKSAYTSNPSSATTSATSSPAQAVPVKRSTSNMISIPQTQPSNADYLSMSLSQSQSYLVGSVPAVANSLPQLMPPLDLSRSLPRSSSPFAPNTPTSNSSTPTNTLGLSTSSGSGSSPTDLSGGLSNSINISLGSAWHQPDITSDWSGYALVKKQWPDNAGPIHLPAPVFMSPLCSSGEAMPLIQAKLWVAGSNSMDDKWQMEHLSGSPVTKLRPKESGSLATLARLFSDSDNEANEWFYLFQSFDGVWYRARLSTCVDPIIGPGFSSSAPQMPVASSAKVYGTGNAKKVPRINLVTLDWQKVSEDYIPQPTVFKKLFGAMGKFFGSPEDSTPQDRLEEEYFDPRKLQITGAISKHFFEHLNTQTKVTKSECFDWATQYRSLQTIAVGKLYKYLLDCQGELPPNMMLRLYSSFHEALEELQLPVPRDFFNRYTFIGYSCLPRQVFLQHVEHGLFHLTEDFVRRLDHTTPENSQFKQLMLNFLSKDSVVRILRRMPEGHMYVVEDAVANESDAQVEIDLDEVEPNEFLPLGAYLQALAKKKQLPPETLQFVGEETSRYLKRKDVLQGPTTIKIVR